MDFLETVSSFLSVVGQYILKFVDFLLSIAYDVGSFFNFIFSVVLEVPVIILTIFNNLPDFMQTGISIITTGVLLIFALKILKIIRDVLI